MSRAKVIEAGWGPGSEPSDDGSGTVASPRTKNDTSLNRLDVVTQVLGVSPVGFGSVAWLSIGPVATGLVIAGSTRALRIGETGQVPEIEIDNLGGTPVLVPAHLVLIGGWQTRAVERSVVVPATTRARVPVKCVEAGRWAPRDEQTSKTFEVAERTSLRTRLSTAQSMSEQLTQHGRFSAEQSTVWQHIEQELTRSPETSHTRSYEAYLKGTKRAQVDAVQKAKVAVPEGANALLLLPREGGFWLEALPSTDLFAAQLEDLLADLFDPTTPPARAPAASHTMSSTEAILRQIWAISLRPLDPIAGSIGSSFALLDDRPEAASSQVDGVAGAVLLVDGSLAHISLGRAPSREELGAPMPSDRRPERRLVSDVSALSAPASRPEPREGAASPKREQRPRDNTTEGSFSSTILPRPPTVVGEGASNDRPKISRETMRAVYAKARELLPEEPPAREAVQGYRLLRALDGNVSWVDLRFEGDAYAVLGSHERCDLVLPSDPALWLRHLIATCVHLDDGTVALRLIDLKTDVPFFLEDDTPQWSVTATGPFAVRIGRHVVCGFPLGPAPVAPVSEGNASVGRTQNIEGATRGRGTFDALATRQGDTRASHLVAQEPFTVVPSAPVSQIQELIAPNASPNHARVTLERGGMGASVELAITSLDAGVLLGRALNCFDGGLRRIFCDAVSRAHVLLLRAGDEIYAFDLCTTNGTRASGRRIRRVKLSNEGSVLELGKKVTFRWHRRPPADASAEPIGRQGSFIRVDAPPGTPPIDPKKLN